MPKQVVFSPSAIAGVRAGSEQGILPPNVNAQPDQLSPVEQRVLGALLIRPGFVVHDLSCLTEYQQDLRRYFMMTRYGCKGLIFFEIVAAAMFQDVGPVVADWTKAVNTTMLFTLTAASCQRLMHARLADNIQTFPGPGQ